MVIYDLMVRGCFNHCMHALYASIFKPIEQCRYISVRNIVKQAKTRQKGNKKRVEEKEKKSESFESLIY